MPGPNNADEACSWIKNCAENYRYRERPHFWERLKHDTRGDGKLENKTSMDVAHALQNMTEVLPYPDGTPTQGGTCWRVYGPSLDDDEGLGIGVEAFLDHKKRQLFLITVFLDERK